MFLDSNGKKWFKGNLHTHSTRTDGRLPPETVIGLYREAGYDFLALTDHWKLSPHGKNGPLLLLPGCEYDVGQSARDGVYHIVGVGMERDPGLERHPGLTPQEIIDKVNQAGGLAILAHPAWSMNRAEAVQRLRGLAGVEIYNTTSGAPWNVRPYSGGIVDLLAAAGCRLTCMAADDAHHYDGDETRSYLLVQAEECSAPAILAALREGRFYASQGPRFSIRRDGGILEITCSPVQEIRFFSDSVYVPDRVIRGKELRGAQYRIAPWDTFVRVEFTDRGGKEAWSSPLPV